MTSDNRMTPADMFMSTAEALGLTPRQRREGLDEITRADAKIRQAMDRELDEQ